MAAFSNVPPPLFQAVNAGLGTGHGWLIPRGAFVVENNGKLPVSVLIVDDFALWRNQLRNIFESDPGFQVIGEAADGAEAVLKSQSLHPDLILLDVNLPRKGGIAAAQEISKLLPKSRVLFFSSDGYSETVRSALNAAGHGYLLKTDVATELIAGARAVLKGERFLSSGVDRTGTQSVTQR